MRRSEQGGGEWGVGGYSSLLSPLPSLPLELADGMKLGLVGGSGGPWPARPVVLLALSAGIWNELDRKIPSDIGRGFRAGGGGLCSAGGRSPYDFRVAESLT